MLLAGGVEDYEYLNKSQQEVDYVKDREEWNKVKVHSYNTSLSCTALTWLSEHSSDMVGFSPAEQFNIFCIVAMQ